MLKIHQTINSRDSISSQSYRVLGFSGIANGNALTRNYVLTDIAGYFLKIISINIDYYNDNSIWIRDNAFVNKTFTEDTNQRYALVRPYTQLKYSDLMKADSTSYFSLLLNGNSLNIFPQSFIGELPEKYNIIAPLQVNGGLDVKMLALFYNDAQSNTTANPFVIVNVAVQLLENLEQEKITNAITV